nr:LPP20 family lipoprotein [uncultured Sulfurimonas sp.]
MLSKNKIIKSSLLLISTTLIFAGCGGSSATPAPAPAPKVLPAWINAPLPSDNEQFMYGMSIEADRDSAIKAALSDMIAKLGTTIESTYESNEEVQGAFVNSNIKNQIKSDVSKVKINNYKVINSHKVSYREFAVMIETDKKKLVSGLKENLEAQKKSITQKYNSLKGRDALTSYNTKKELSQDASKLLSEVLIISELDKSFNKKDNLDFITQKQKQFLAESKSLKFFVSGNSESEKFVNSIKNYLAQGGFNVTNSKNNAVQVKVNTTDRLSGKIAILNINVSVYDKTQRIGGKSVIVKERYNGSKASAYKNASIHLEQDIKSQGINKVIGINLNID